MIIWGSIATVVAVLAIAVALFYRKRFRLVSGVGLKLTTRTAHPPPLAPPFNIWMALDSNTMRQSLVRIWRMRLRNGDLGDDMLDDMDNEHQVRRSYWGHMMGVSRAAPPLSDDCVLASVGLYHSP